MMTSEQIAQANSHAFSMGYGMNPQFGYEPITGITPMGYGAGSQFGVGAISTMNSAAGAASMIGLGSLLGKGALGMAGFGNSAIATGLGRVAALTGATLPLPLAFGALMPGMAALGGLASGAQQLSGVQNTLDQNFGNRTNMGGGFGFGMSRQATLGITETMRSLKALPSMMTDMGELQGILDKVSSMGMMQAVRNASEFKTKFTSMVSALREMSRDLGSTMEQAMPFLQSSVRQGFLDADSMRRNVTRGVATSRIGIGMRPEDVMQMQEQGAGLVRSMGGDSRIGAIGMQGMLGSLSVAQQQGVISQEDVTRITGQTGAEGIKSLSSMIFGAQAQLFQQQGAGRFLTAALAERDSSGKFTGALNADIVDKLKRGEISSSELIGRGSKMLSGMKSEDALSFMNAMNKGMGAEAAAMIGPSGSASAITAILESLGAKGEEAQRFLIMQMTGMRQDAADAALKIMKEGGRLQDEQNAQIREAVIRGRSAAYFKENLTLSGKMHHAQTSLQAMFVDPIQRAGAGLATRIGERFDQSMQEFLYTQGAMGKIASIPGGIMHTFGLNPFRDDPYTQREGATERGMGRILSGRHIAGAPATDEIAARSIDQRLSGRNNKGKIVGGAIGTMFGIPGVAVGAGIGAAYDAYTEEDTGTRIARNNTALFGAGNVRESGELLNIEGAFSVPNHLQVDSNIALAQKLLEESGITRDTLNLRRGDLFEKLAGLSIEDTAGDQVSGLSMLGLAAQGDGATAQLASELMQRTRDLLEKRDAASQSDAAAAQTGLRELFDPGFFDTMGGSLTAAYSGGFASDAASSIMNSGDQDSQRDLQQLLGNKELRDDLAMADGSLRLVKAARAKIERVFGRKLALTDEQLASLSRDLAEVKDEFGSFTENRDAFFKNVSTQMGDYLKTIEDYEASVSSTELDNIISGVGDEGLRGALRSGGFDAAHLAKIREAAGQSTGDDRLTTAFKKSFERTHLRKNETEKQASARLKRMGVDSSGLLNDDGTLDDDERRRIEDMLAFSGAIEPELRMNMSDANQRSRTLGADGELDMELRTAHTEAMRANVEFIREVGNVVPALKKAADQASTRMTN